MTKLFLPSVPPILGGNVVIPNEVWDKLISYLGLVHDTVNQQADKIVALTKELSKCRADIKILAEALGGVYNAQE